MLGELPVSVEGVVAPLLIVELLHGSIHDSAGPGCTASGLLFLEHEGDVLLDVVRVVRLCVVLFAEEFSEILP